VQANDEISYGSLARLLVDAGVPPAIVIQFCKAFDASNTGAGDLILMLGLWLFGCREREQRGGDGGGGPPPLER
jgi:hypothetical protein